MRYHPVPQRVVPHAPLQTFKVRRGRLGAQAQATLDRLWPQYGVRVEPGAPVLDLDALFGRRAPVVLEIGSGMGEATALAADSDRARNVLAVEVHTPGIARLLQRVEDAGLVNVRVADGDARVLLRDLLAPACLDEVRIWFPDPWPKARHAKRRLVDGPVLDLLAQRVRPGGVLSFATDWPPYAEVVSGLLDGHPAWEITSTSRPPSRPQTKFEARGDRAGRPAHDLVARRR